ncbi:hypothetical protein AgCh_026290 [Apium graveolens]
MGVGFGWAKQASARQTLAESIQPFGSDASVKQADWDVSKLRDKLCRDMRRKQVIVSCQSLSNSFTLHKKLELALSKPVQLLLESGAIKTWESIRNLLKHETSAIVEGLRAAVIGQLMQMIPRNDVFMVIRLIADEVDEMTVGVASPT